MQDYENYSHPKKTLATKVILPLTYLPPIEHFRLMCTHNEVVFDINEHFHKQFYYNRCEIYGANGQLKLSIPVIRRGHKQAIKDVKISYNSNWQILHWRSMEAAYRRSPYFEFYESFFSGIHTDFKPVFLADWNMKLLEVVLNLLKLKPSISFTTEYFKEYPEADDYRKLASPAEVSLLPPIKKYQQVFEERYGFLSSLSIIDLLFCEGNHAIEYLKLP